MGWREVIIKVNGVLGKFGGKNVYGVINTRIFEVKIGKAHGIKVYTRLESMVQDLAS